MKKLLASALALTMAFGMTGLAAPEATVEAAPSMPVAVPYAADAPADIGSDARLAAVTLKVKNLLNLDTDDYEEFSGNLNENALAPTWSLNWSGVNGSLSITATEDGELLNLYRYEYDYYRDPFDNAFGPRYVKDNSAAALQAAQAFAAKVINAPVETVKLEAAKYTPYYASRPAYVGSENYNFSSVIYLNGQPSPLSMNISVRTDGTVTSFNRDTLTGNYLGEIPSATPATTESAARALLRGTLDMNLEYVSGGDGKTALLRYLPKTSDDFYVDAATGKLVNLSELFRNVTEIYDDSAKRSMAGGAPAPEAVANFTMMDEGAQLSETELAGVEKLEGVMDKDALAAAVSSAYPELGLDWYSLANASYYVSREKDSDSVDCTLTFSKKLGDGIIRRTVSLDAKTADFKSVYTSYPWQENKSPATVTFAAAGTKATSFLQAHFSTELAKTEQTDSHDAAAYTYGLTDHSFTYTRKENGYLYRDNSVNIGIDPLDGSVASFSRNWADDIAFDSPAGIVSKDAAIDAYLNAYLANPSYIAIPKALDGAAPQYQILREQGYGYFYALSLGYRLTLEDGWFVGVDAKDGTAIVDRASYEEQKLTYTDLAGSWAKASIERLAVANIGYAGGSFQPAKSLTQLDLIALLVSANGSVYDLAEENAADNIYNSAYNAGILKKADRNDGKVLTRMEMTRLILDASGYGRVAQIGGIFTCSFSDAAEIPAALYGYAAIAQGLGILRGNSAGHCMANAAATRAEAAAMLDQFMSR